jgi:hypothetical protein
MRTLAIAAVALVGCAHPRETPARKPDPVVVRNTSDPAPDAPASSDAPVIPTTDVPDTAENRAVIELCERYRTALEARDLSALLALASPQYLDDGGTPDPSDDTRHAELESYLEGLFKDVEQVRYEIRYRKIRFEGERVVVGLTYSATFRIAGKFRRSVQDNEMVLERHDGSYRFLSGM